MRTKFSGILTLLLAFVVQVGLAQEKTITGTVTDADSGMPLAGVNIVIEGTSTGTQTDFDGNYSLEASTGQTLVFSYLGYLDKQVTVGTDTSINVTMSVSAAELDQVVITALGIKRKKDEVASSYQVVENEELTQAAAPNVVNALTGKVTGLNIQQTNSGVSGNTRIVLRGQRSLTGNNQALIVIDGAISSANFLQSLNPNIIASVNVIKGPSGAALYGSQGSNGVLIVTTKKGTTDERMKVILRSSVQFEEVSYVPEVQTRYGQGWNSGVGYSHVLHENGTWGPEFDGQLTPIGLPQDDGDYIYAPFSSRGAYNFKDFYDTGITYINGVTISSGGDDGYLLVSAQNQNTEFVIENDILKASTYSFKGGKTLGKWRIAGNATYSYTATEETFQGVAGNRLIVQLLQTPTNVPIEQFENVGNEGHWNGYYLNPYWIRDNIRRNRDSDRFSVLGEIEYSYNDHISTLIRSNGTFNFQTTLNYANGYTDPQYIVDIVGLPRTVTSSFQYFDTNFSQYYTDIINNFNYDLTDDISFQANIGANVQYQKTSFVGVGGIDLTIPGIYSSNNLSGEFSSGATGDNRTSRSRLGVFGNVDFGYKDFLFLNLTGRNDWSSVLPKDNNSFFYPSAGLSFIPTKAFPELEGDVLNYAKIAATYVKTGDDGQGTINPYAIQQVYVQAPGFPYGGLNSFVSPVAITDPNIEPQFTTSFEINMNLGFLDNRITLDAAYYNFETDNQILGVSPSFTSGIARSNLNIGKTKGYGIELTLGLTPFKTEDFEWNIRAGYSNPENEVVKVSDQVDQFSYGVGFIGFAEIAAIEGEPFPALLASSYVRDPQGRVVIDPATGDPIVDTELQNQGQTTPDYIVNLNSTIRYKGFSLSASMDYRTGHVFYSNAKNGNTFAGYLIESAQPGRGPFIWPNSSYESPAGSGNYVANTNIPSGGTTAGDYIPFWNTYSTVGENFVLDATAFKLREVALSYTVDEKFLKNTFFSGITLTAVGRNLVTVLPEENRGYNDPESSFVSGNAVGITTSAQYPPTRSYGLVVNLTF